MNYTSAKASVGPVPSTVNSNELPKTKSSRWSRCSAALLGCVLLVSAVFGVLVFVSGGKLFLDLNGGGGGGGGNTVVTMALVAEHNTPEVDCWLIMHGKVYDLTNYKHPGGQGWIWDSCGEDATTEYKREHKESLLGSINQFLVGPVGTAEDAATAAAAAATDGGGTTGNLRPQAYVEPESFDSDSEDTFQGKVEAPPVVQQATTRSGIKCVAAQDVSSHSSRQDCWYILYGKVYDFTDYINRHPGGARVVLQECGTDATIAYSAAKRHDESLLNRKAAEYILGQVC